jgi:hypothetical protein
VLWGPFSQGQIPFRTKATEAFRITALAAFVSKQYNAFVEDESDDRRHKRALVPGLPARRNAQGIQVT